MSPRLILGVLLAALSIAGCDKLLPNASNKPPVEAPAAAPTATVKDAGTTEKTTRGSEPGAGGFRESPDFGGVQSVSIEAEGFGPTANIASLRALDSAIAQVNGRRVSSSTEAGKVGMVIDVDSLLDADLSADVFADRVVSASDGTVKSFRVLSSEEIERTDSERTANLQIERGGWLAGNRLVANETEKHMTRYWKVRVKADVAKFVGPKDDGRPSITIAAPRQSGDGYVVGDTRVAAAGVGAEIRRRLSDALTQTGRFKVLDREFSAEMQEEIDFINSGNARSDAAAKLGQQLSTDLILVPTIERFAYPRSSRQLRMSDRQLVSYSGGGAISLRLINAATGEVVMSESFAHDLGSTGPSTLPRSVDGVGMAGRLMDSLSGQMTKAVINKIFPVSVVALAGNQAVLSQGGQSVAAGQRYDAVILGEALKDPQTGRSLGRMEIPCCVIRVDRVADKTSYGTIEGALPAQLSAFKPGMVELRGLAGAPAPSADGKAAPDAAGATAKADVPRPAPRRASASAAAAKPAADGGGKPKDEDW